MITGESVKSAVGPQIALVFEGIPWYKEVVTRAAYPHFFVHEIGVSIKEDTKNRYWLDYMINVRYREAQEAEKTENLQQKLDQVGFLFLSSIEKITLEDRQVRLKNMRFEKVDGVLHCFCQVRIRVKKPEVNVLMHNLQEKIGTKED